MNPSELFDSIEADIADGLRTEMEKIADDVKDRISVPVGYAIGPRGGTRIIRSKPGEPPRKETGTLQAGVTFDVIRVQGQIDFSVYDEVPYAAPLEDQLDRPILSDLGPAYEDSIADSIVDAINGSSTPIPIEELSNA